MLTSKKPEQSFGLDISDLSLKIVQLEKYKHKINIQALSQIDLPKGIIDNGIIKDKDTAIKLLKKLINKPKFGDINSSNVVACLPEPKTYIKLIETNKTPNNINDIIENEIEKNIPISIDEMYYDWQLINKFQNKDLILIGAASKKIVDSYVDFLHSAQLSISAFEIESTAICRSLLIEENYNKTKQLPKNYCIIDIGAARSSLVIYSQNTIILSVSIPISGNEATEKIAKTLEIKKDQAEKAKIICGLDKTKAQGVIHKILSGRIDNLIKKIKNALNFYYENHQDYGPINQIILCGGGSNMKKLDELINKATGIQTIVGDPLLHLEENSEKIFKKIQTKHKIKDKTINKSEKAISVNQSVNLSYTTAIGLALRDIFVTNS